MSIARRRARLDGEPRAGLRLRRGRARPLERGRLRGNRRRRRCRDRGRGSGRAAARRNASRPACVRALRTRRRATASASSTASRSSAGSARVPPRSPLGLVAGQLPSPARADARAAPAHARCELEGHADNLAAALLGGVCVSWRANGDGARRADRGPTCRWPRSLAVPAGRTNTAHSRNGLPATVPHEDAAANAGYAAMLGAAIASGDRSPARATRSTTGCTSSTVSTRRRSCGAAGEPARRRRVGVTLSGSGPSVVVWAAPERADSVAAELRDSLPDDTRVLQLRVAQEGARLA